MALRPPARGYGFTLIELVVVLVVAGILAAVVAPRFISRGGFASRGFYDEGQAVVRFAQKTAIAWRRTIFVCVTTTEISASLNTGCATPLNHPVTNAALRSTAPGGVTLAPTGEFSFNGMGQPIAGTIPLPANIALTSTISGDPARQIVVEAETGYVHR